MELEGGASFTHPSHLSPRWTLDARSPPHHVSSGRALLRLSSVVGSRDTRSSNSRGCLSRNSTRQIGASSRRPEPHWIPLPVIPSHSVCDPRCPRQPPQDVSVRSPSHSAFIPYAPGASMRQPLSFSGNVRWRRCPSN